LDGAVGSQLPVTMLIVAVSPTLSRKVTVDFSAFVKRWKIESARTQRFDLDCHFYLQRTVYGNATRLFWGEILLGSGWTVHFSCPEDEQQSANVRPTAMESVLVSRNNSTSRL
jgi:hypothetical protein